MNDTAVCFVDYCIILMRVLQVRLCFCCRCCRRKRSTINMIVPWALGRVTAQYAHRTAHPTHMASINSLRITAVNHRAHTQRQQQEQ